MWEENHLPHCLLGGVLVVKSGYNSKFKWKVLQYSAAAVTVVLTSSSSATISPLHHPLEKVLIVSSSWAVSLLIQLLTSLSKIANQLSWLSSATSLAVQPPLLTTMRTILSKWTEAWSFLVFLCPLLSQSSLPAWLPWEPSYLSGPSPCGPAWLSFSFPHEFALLSSHLPCSKDKFCFFGIL
jgi:hypothetical protein